MNPGDHDKKDEGNRCLIPLSFRRMLSFNFEVSDACQMAVLYHVDIRRISNYSYMSRVPDPDHNSGGVFIGLLRVYDVSSK